MSTVPISKKYRYEPALEKPLPQNLDAERSVLGAILIDNACVKKTRDIVNPSDFLSDYNRRIYMKALEMSEAAQPIDLVTLTDAFHSEGKLEAAGGAAYLAQLLDGVPGVTNVEFYAKIVRTKSLYRGIIHSTHAVQQAALSEEKPPEELFADLARIAGLERKESGLVACDILQFLEMELAPTEFVLNPILPVKGIGMLYAWRGVGKTNVMLEIAYCIAAGIKKCFVWEIPVERKVVYVDGEMDSAGLQERLREIAAGHAGDGFPVVSSMTLVTPDLQKNIFPNIGTAAGQRQIEKLLSPGCVLVLDNLSSLCPSGEEHETDNWVAVQEWLLYLRRCGITVLFLHHAGKGGTQRGWSGREDILNLTLALRRPADYQTEDGLRCEIHIEKLRGKAVGVGVQPFEVQMASVDGHTEWTQRPLRQIIERQAFAMFSDGMKVNDVADALKLSRWQAHRLKKKHEQGSGSRED
jgi:hypothetical protein